MEKNIDWLERCNREEKIKLAVVGSVVIIGTRNSCDDTNGCLLNLSLITHLTLPTTPYV